MIEEKTALHNFRPAPRTSKVYFIASEGAIKIGCSMNPEMRLGELQVGSHHKLEIIGLIEGDREMEISLQERFKHLHLRGEWFSAGPDLMAFIQSLEPIHEPEPEPEPEPIVVVRPRPMPRRTEFDELIAGLIRKRPTMPPELRGIVSTLAEQIECLRTYERPAWALDERQTLPYRIKKQIAHLSN